MLITHTATITTPYHTKTQTLVLRRLLLKTPPKKRPSGIVLTGIISIFRRYRELSANDVRLKWLWEILSSFSKEELVAFLRFVSGRSRLPTNLNDMPHKFQIVGTERVRDIPFNLMEGVGKVFLWKLVSNW